MPSPRSSHSPRSPRWSVRILERMTALASPRHRDLVQAMLSELHAIADAGERRRFALGAAAAIVRLALGRLRPTKVESPLPRVAVMEHAGIANRGNPVMSTLSIGQLLRRHLAPLAATFVLITTILLSMYGARQLPVLSARGASANTLLEVVMLAVPFTVALSIPTAVFMTVLWVFTRPDMKRVLVEAQREQRVVRRVLLPVLTAAAAIALLTFASNAELVPRANARLATIITQGPRVPSDREMTIGQLREAANTARADARPGAAARAMAYEVEIQKKFALAAACLVLALTAATIALRFLGGGTLLVIGASATVLGGYYVSIMAGEQLADRLLVSPFVAMWVANAILLAVSLLLIRRQDQSTSTPPAESLTAGS